MNNNAKKIASIVIISIVLLLTVATIVLAVVPLKMYNPISEDYKRIVIYRDGVSNSYNCGNLGTEESNKICNELMDLHDKSLQDNILSNLFQGTLSFEKSVVNNSYTDLLTTFNADGKVCLVFEYLEEQTLKIDGEEYKDVTAFASNTVTFNKIYMPIINSESFEENMVYLANTSNKSSYQVKFIAHQSEIFKYIVNLNWPLVKA